MLFCLHVLLEVFKEWRCVGAVMKNTKNDYIQTLEMIHEISISLGFRRSSQALRMDQTI